MLLYASAVQVKEMGRQFFDHFGWVFSTWDLNLLTKLRLDVNRNLRQIWMLLLQTEGYLQIVSTHAYQWLWHIYELDSQAYTLEHHLCEGFT